MTEFISTYSIDFNNLKTSESIDQSDWDSLLCDNDGSFTTEHDLMFNIDGLEVWVNFSVSVGGRVIYDRGDYWTPPSSDTYIDYVDIDIISVTIDEYEVELDKELRSIFESKINNLINV